nr:hypothetical protein [Tanacetum cinerariifolium]
MMRKNLREKLKQKQKDVLTREKRETLHNLYYEPTIPTPFTLRGEGSLYKRKERNPRPVGLHMVQKIPVSVIPETTNFPPIPEIVTETLITTADPSPQVTPIISTVQQTTTRIPTPTITTDAPTITTTVLESNALTDVELRVVKLEKDVSELKTGDHSSVSLVVLWSYVPTLVDSYLDTKVRHVFQKELQKHTTNLIHRYSLQHLPKLTKKPTPIAEQEFEENPSKILKIKNEQAESQKNPQFTIKFTDKAALKEYDLKSALYQSMHANMSFNRNPANHRLYHALMEALIEDENAMDKGTKRRRTKESKSTTKETPKGKASTKGSKTGKSASTKEPVEEPIFEVIMDDTSDDQILKGTGFKLYLDQPPQPWFNQLVSASKDPLTFNDLMATPIDFSKYVLNGLKIENPTQDILLGPAFNLLKGTSPGHQIIAANYFFNNDLEYLKTSTKTKAAQYKIKGIEDMVPTLWSIIKHAYDKVTSKGIKHWGKRHKLWYRSQVSKFSKQNVYSTKASIGVKSVSVKKLHGYGHLEEIVVKRSDQ